MSSNDDNDPLQSALAEAQQLMDSIGMAESGDGSEDLGGFAIDSDDEDEEVDGSNSNRDGVEDVPLDDDPLGASSLSGTATGTNANTANTGTAAGPIDVHPLHDDFLQVKTNATNSNPQSVPASTTSTPLSNYGATAAGFLPSMTSNPLSSTSMSGLRMMGVGGGMGAATNVNANLNATANTATPTGTNGPSVTSPASLDAFKAQTTRFASNLASMSQRFASQVATTAAAAGVPVTAGTPHLYGAGGSAGAGTAGNSNPAMSNSPFYTSTMSQQQHQQQQQQQQQPVQMPHTHTMVTLDHDQKLELVKTHLGDLLPGEQVIMFLGNLLHVADSTGFTYSANTMYYNNHSGGNSSASSASSGWCCIMTYYRLVLFSTAHPHASTTTNPYASSSPNNQGSNIPPAGWNPACWPVPLASLNSILQMPLASMDRVEKTVFSSGTTTQQGLHIIGKDNGRWMRFTTSNYAETTKAYESLQTYAFPGRRNLGYLFAFESKRDTVMRSVQEDDVTGQKKVTAPAHRKRFDGITEFARQFGQGSSGANTSGSGSSATTAATGSVSPRPWKVYTHMNKNYATCLSYPDITVGPASLDDDPSLDAAGGGGGGGASIIRQCAAFRSEHRWPALTWSSGVDGASIWRSSQPKIGLQGNRSSADELYLRHVLESASAANAMAATTTTNHNINHIRPNLTRTQLIQLTGTTDLSRWVVNDAGPGVSASGGIIMGTSNSPNGSSNSPTTSPGGLLKIMDLRPRAAAMANRTGGYGYENTAHYHPGTSLQFCNIGNIHAVRDAYQKLSTLAHARNISDAQWTTAVEDTKWLSMVRLIWSAAWEAAYWVHVYRLPVLLHCSHGWDRTSQVAALSQLLLDPYYRTREGFSCLVEKDFLSFGHPIHLRCAHGEGRGANQGGGGGGGGAMSEKGSAGGSGAGAAPPMDEGQISPIFIQFLDCVYQLVSLYPECFEFNTVYLLVLSEHVYSCRFGNFLCDTERERELVAGLRQRTHSVWEYLDQRTDTLNDGYRHSSSAGVMLMPLPLLLRHIHVWTDRHCRHGPKTSTRPLARGLSVPEDTRYSKDQQGPLTTHYETYKAVSRMADDVDNVEAASSSIDYTSGTSAKSSSNPVNDDASPLAVTASEGEK